MAYPAYGLFLGIVLVVLLNRVLALSSSSLPSSSATTLSHHSIPILLETEHLLVVNKPAGINHHDVLEADSSSEAIRNSTTPGLMTLLKQQLQQQQLYGVHRLDQVTSGVLVVAKTPRAAQCLTQAFTDRHVVKYYTGLSYQTPSQRKQGWIRGYMRRGRRKSWYLTREQQSDTKDPWAETYYWTAGLGNLASGYQGPATAHDTNLPTASPSPPRTLLLFRPYTGRTHQLRVAAKSVGLSLAGDPLYTTVGNSNKSNQMPPTPLPRACLHATGLHIAQEHLVDLGLPDDLTVWSHPPFLDWWEAGSQPDAVRLLQKDVSVPVALVQAAREARQRGVDGED